MNELNVNLENLKTELSGALKSATTHEALENIRCEFLGRKGKIADLMGLLANAAPEQKRVLGPRLNSFKQEANDLYTNALNQLRIRQEQEHDSAARNFDVTATISKEYGSLHPTEYVLQRIEDIFISMGFTIVQGPEVETEFYNFEALNIGKDHPARDMWDTFFLDTPDIPGMLLRTHTSSVQIHTMKNSPLPLAVVAPGRCFRHEATDASHDIQFMQAEGLLVGKNITMSHLFGTVRTFLQTLFQKEVTLRMRPSYFPFVEPGVEIDVSCPFCKEGCSVCKKTRWIEICGAGLVHPHVLESCGIDNSIYSGFAFGFGLTRLVMLHYGIDDIRLLSQTKIPFLKQF